MSFVLIPDCECGHPKSDHEEPGCMFVMENGRFCKCVDYVPVERSDLWGDVLQAVKDAQLAHMEAMNLPLDSLDYALAERITAALVGPKKDGGS